MKARFLAQIVLLILVTVMAGGCTDILTKQKVGGFGDSPGTGATPPLTPGTTIGTSSYDSLPQMRQGSIYTTCYPACIKSPKKSVDDCDKACCLAQCQPRTPEDTKRCAFVCGVNLEKTTNI
ncbi:MAG: hypothetical protein Q8R70_08610 [Methanoregula sp.]|nr:hypothetical protein [Methanoregula sp.]